AVRAARGIAPPVRRAQPLHAPALLVDQHRGGGPLDGPAQPGGQRLHLLWGLDVAAEEVEAPGPRVGEERLLGRAQHRAGAAVAGAGLAGAGVAGSGVAWATWTGGLVTGGGTCGAGVAATTWAGGAWTGAAAGSAGRIIGGAVGAAWIGGAGVAVTGAGARA